MAKSEGTTKIRHHHIKSNQFRVVHADGMFGGVTPHGYIHFVIWNERQAIPLEVESEVDSAGKVISEKVVSTREGFVRELEVDVLMDLITAKSFRVWLDDKIKQLEELTDSSQHSQRNKDDSD